MKFAQFERHVVNDLGYKSLSAFAEQTKLTTRSSITKWRKDNEVPALMAAYIQECVRNAVSDEVVTRIACDGVRARVSGDLCLFERGDLVAFIVKNDYFAPEFALGDFVLGHAYIPGEALEEGFWVFEADGKQTLGALRRNPDGTFHLFGNAAYTTGFAIHFGIEHTRKEMRPVARVRYHVKKKG